jgi:geranylgeranyl pyrophosphate synthase
MIRNHILSPVAALGLAKGIDARQLAAAMALPDHVEERLGGALRHVIRHPGNLVRPRIVLQMSAAYGLPESDSEELSTAPGYFHSASLLFDDLPSMDDASQRCGVSRTHLLFGESSPILAALALINRAYMLVWRAAHDLTVSMQIHMDRTPTP